MLNDNPYTPVPISGDDSFSSDLLAGKCLFVFSDEPSCGVVFALAFFRVAAVISRVVWVAVLGDFACFDDVRFNDFPDWVHVDALDRWAGPRLLFRWDPPQFVSFGPVFPLLGSASSRRSCLEIFVRTWIVNGRREFLGWLNYVCSILCVR
uniref:Uncharacterized protein n=1 Tax=Opuntia streptacantha TaxID=393608 RepID=A0A7C9DU99_OPUST